MARRANPAAGPAATEEHEEQTPLTGGASGIPTEQSAAVQAPRVRDPDEPQAPPPKRFVVLEERKVAISGLIVRMPVGKILDGSNYDVDALLKQGLRVRDA